MAHGSLVDSRFLSGSPRISFDRSGIVANGHLGFPDQELSDNGLDHFGVSRNPESGEVGANMFGFTKTLLFSNFGTKASKY